MKLLPTPLRQNMKRHWDKDYKEVDESGIRKENDPVEPVILIGVVGERKG
jgi:hypothetical protein